MPRPWPYLFQKSVLGLELLGEVHGAVYEAKPGGLATSASTLVLKPKVSAVQLNILANFSLN